MAMIGYKFPVGPGSVQELDLSAEELPKTERKMGVCGSQHAAHSIDCASASGQHLCKALTVCSALALGGLATTAGTA